MRSFILQLVLSALIFFTQSVNAADEKESDTACDGDCVAIGEWQIAVAVGIGGRTNPILEQSDLPLFVFADVRYYGKRFFLESMDFGYTFIDTPRHQLHGMLFSPGYDHVFFNNWDLSSLSLDNLTPESPVNDVAQPGSEFDTPSDASNTSEEPAPGLEFNLKKRRFSGMSGFEYTYTHDKFEFQFQALKDITNIHHGSKIRAAVTVPFQYDKNTLLVTAGLTEQSAKLLDYYYGLDESEAPNENYVYQADRGLSSYFRLDFRRPINKHWLFRGIASYKRLGSAITDSPIVVDEGVFTVFVGGVYHF